jgi:spore coat protein U-like protein
MKKYLIVILFIFFMMLSFWWARAPLAACSVSTNPVNFGNYDVLSSAPDNATGSVTVNCNQAPPPLVTISIGSSPTSGGFDPRMMMHATGNDTISYNFFVDSVYTQIWGDGSGNTFTKSSKVNKNRPWVTTIYGRIPPGQDVSVGNYSDTLTVIISY